VLQDQPNLQNGMGRALESLMKESKKCISIAAEMVGSGRHDDVDLFCGKNCE